MEDANFNKMSSSHITAWKLGLKTGIYYFRTKPGANAIKFTINNNKFKAAVKEEDDYDEGCINCSA